MDSCLKCGMTHKVGVPMCPPRRISRIRTLWIGRVGNNRKLHIFANGVSLCGKVEVFRNSTSGRTRVEWIAELTAERMQWLKRKANIPCLSCLRASKVEGGR